MVSMFKPKSNARSTIKLQNKHATGDFYLQLQQHFYDNRPGNEVGLFYNALEPTRGLNV